MNRRLTTTLIVLWAVAVLSGMIVLTHYNLRPGRAAAAPAAWPAPPGLMRPPGRPALVMIAHPKCACTRSSLDELALLLTHCPGRASTTVIFVRSPGAGPDWDDTDLHRHAQSIPGVQVLTDDGGTVAERFGAWTSGQVLLYDANGRLRFSGGITAGRGHSGDNAGRSALEAFLRGTPARASTPVFGCDLFSPAVGPGRRSEVALRCRN